ncbi:la-related protein 6-like [Portunus trituberculatus]|uniref:la-related protein 6-like n=1 Tax=Portunus trituberculatus TaxID=210409 RepID=UPI001E1D148F|nr:la-related protein 6-like [Portunus trituberculatus]
MAAVSEECLAVVPQLVPPVSLMDDEVTTSDSETSSNEMVILESSPKGLAGQHIRLPAQTSLPLELAAKLERQDSDDSVVSSTEEEGIQADSAPEVCDIETRIGEGLEPRSERSSSVVSDGSEEGGRDSGIEAEREPDMVVPDEEQMARIVAQVEFYFSDANVAKDKFLLKHIRRNKEGYVSLKLVSSFKKVKQLTKDWRVVSYSLNKKSSKIQINDLGTKIRRVDPLPDLEEVPVTCAVLALALPLAKPSIQSVSELFASCGDIAFIRVVRAGTAIPQDLKGLAAKHTALSDTNCAWIEFETPEAAKAATEMNTEEGLKVVPILPEAQKKPEKAPQQKGSQPNSRKNSVTSNSGYGSPINKGPPSRKNSVGTKSRKDSGLGSDVEIPMPQPRYPRRKCLSLPQTQSPNLKELSAVVEARKNRPKSKSCTEFQLGSPPPTSWVQRNLLAAAAASAASAASPVVGSRPPLTRPNRVSHGSLPIPEGVLRFPKGPDGSKGFSPIHRRRTMSAQETVPRPGSPSARGSDTGSRPATPSDKPSATTPAPATNITTTPDITTTTNTSKSNDSGNVSSSSSSGGDSNSSAISSSSNNADKSSGNSENSSSNTDGS